MLIWLNFKDTVMSDGQRPLESQNPGGHSQEQLSTIQHWFRYKERHLSSAIFFNLIFLSLFSYCT